MAEKISKLRDSRGFGWFVLLGPNLGSGPGLGSAASVPFQREQFLQAEQESCLLVGKIPLQESITKQDTFVLHDALLESPAPGCQHRDAPMVWKGTPKQPG